MDGLDEQTSRQAARDQGGTSASCYMPSVEQPQGFGLKNPHTVALEAKGCAPESGFYACVPGGYAIISTAGALANQCAPGIKVGRRLDNRSELRAALRRRGLPWSRLLQETQHA